VRGVTRTVEQLLAREVGEDWRPVYVHGFAYYADSTETDAEQVALHEHFIRVHEIEQRRREKEIAGTKPPGQDYFDGVFATIFARLAAIEKHLGPIAEQSR
jgi:hypothetical protein